MEIFIGIAVVGVIVILLLVNRKEEAAAQAQGRTNPNNRV